MKIFFFLLLTNLNWILQAFLPTQRFLLIHRIDSNLFSHNCFKYDNSSTYLFYLTSKNHFHISFNYMQQAYDRT